jgi:hypothetical protein
MPTGLACVAMLAATLTGCGSSDTASLVIDGPDTAVTLERIRAYAWTSEWELQLIVRRFPECQRRHNLASASQDGFQMDLYSPAPGAFIIRQGKHWYVADLKSCALQEFKVPPPEPGIPVGAFIEKDGVLRFDKALSPVAPASPSPAPALAAPQSASS